MSFDGAAAPGQGETCDDGIEVSFESVAEGVQVWQFVCADGADPCREIGAGAVAHHARERVDVASECGQLRAAGEKVVELLFLLSA